MACKGSEFWGSSRAPSDVGHPPQSFNPGNVGNLSSVLLVSGFVRMDALRSDIAGAKASEGPD
jgi:hypothetical protein